MTNLSNSMTVVALSNGMIGGTILVLPLLAWKTGYLLIPAVSIVCGLISFYTSSLTIKHITDYEGMDESLLAHFNGKKRYPIFYNIAIGLSMVALLILYFDLLIKQLVGLMGIREDFQKNYVQKDIITIMPFGLSILLFILTCLMRKFECGSKLLAYGIISIIGYCVFLVWVFATAPSQYSQNPKIVNQIPPYNNLFVDMAASLGMGYAVQNFMIPVLKNNPNKNQHLKLVMYTYLIGILVYTFISYSCFGIVNRHPIQNPQTIQDYFKNPNGSTTWQVMLIQLLYAIHLFSAFPQFLIVAKIRVFSIYDILKGQQYNEYTHQKELSIMKSDNEISKAPQVPIQPIQQTIKSNQQPNKENQHQQQSITLGQYIFFGIFILVCLLLKILKVPLQVIIQLNGAVVCFIYVFLIPISLHIKCVYFNSQQQKCNCWYEHHQYSMFQKIFEGIKISLVFLIGVAIMVYTLYTLFAKKEQ